MRSLLVAALAALTALAPISAAGARPFTVEDLLRQESFGKGAIDPSSRWFVFEQRDVYASAARFDYNQAISDTLSRLKVVDLARPASARPLLAHDPGPGVLMGPYSPDGKRLAVYRLHGRTWSLGVVTLATGAARWFDYAPREPGPGQSIQWLSNRTLLALVRPDRLPPETGKTGWIFAERLPKAWAASARGGTAHTVFGSGAYADVRERPPPVRLLKVDVVTGKAQIAAQGAFFDLQISPDRRRVALLESGPDLQAHGDRPVRAEAGLETEASRLVLLDLSRGAVVRPCPTCDVLPQLLAWSPSGRALLVFARGGDGLWTSGHLIRIEAANGVTQTVGAELTPQADLNPVVVRAAWLGEDPVVFARPRGDRERRADWYRLAGSGPVNLTAEVAAPGNRLRAADDTHLVLFGQGGVWRVHGDGHAELVLAGDAAPALHDVRGLEQARLANVAPAGSWVTVGSGARRELFWLTTAGAEPAGSVSPETSPLVAAAASTRVAVVHDTDLHGVERMRLLRPGQQPLTLSTINRRLRDTDPQVAWPIKHVGADGARLTSWLLTPSGDRPDRRPPPLLVRPYLGARYPTAPRDLYAEQGFYSNLRVLTGHGYAVLVPSLPNPPGGMTEPAAHLADRLNAVEDAARATPDLAGRYDPDRAALLGWSFGGYTVMAAITQTDRYRAAVELDGISDLVAYWAHMATSTQLAPEDHYGSNWTTGGVEFTQPEMKVPPWRDPERYHRNSPLLFADRITTPLLLIHGYQDPIPIAGSEAMYSALFRQGKDAELVAYWGANHWATSPGDIRDIYRRIFSFLDDHFAGAVRPRTGATPSPAGASASTASRPLPPPR